MRTPNTIEDEINQIRLKIYEETKDMTSAQITEYYSKSAEAAFKRIGYKMVVINPQGHRKLVKVQPGEPSHEIVSPMEIVTNEDD